MDIKKIIGIIILVITISSCGNNSNEFIPKSEFDHLMKEYNELKDENKVNQNEVMNQGEILNKTLQELSVISNSTIILRRNIENRSAKITQADNIQSHIAGIKAQIAQYEKTISKNSELQKTLSSLKTMVLEKEKEIITLKSVIDKQSKEIVAQKAEISYQKKEINKQSDIITTRERELQIALNQQMEFIYQAGVEFERIATEDIDIKNTLFRNNKKRMESYKKQILQKAAQYYNLAEKMGHQKAKTKMNKFKYYL